MPEPVFSVRGLCFAYGEQGLLRGLDLEVPPGCFYGVLGPNGCGKTTLLDLLSGARRPDAGRVLFQGRDAAPYPRKELARRLALVPQEVEPRFPFTVRETVLMGRHPHLARFAPPGPEDLAAVEAAMDQADVTHLASKPVTRLSGGEKQRVALARALAQRAPVLLLDEPTSHLDVHHALSVLSGLELAVQRDGLTVVAVMHDLGLAAAYCDHLALIRDGRVFAAGPAGEVLTAHSLRAVFQVAARVGWDEFAGSRTVTFRKAGAMS